MNKILLLLSFGLFVSLSVIAQKKKQQEQAKPDSAAYYMRNEHDMAFNEQDAKFLRLIIKADSGLFKIEDYYMDAKPKLVTRSSIDAADFRKGTQGIYIEYFTNGNKKKEAFFNKGILVGDGIEYYSNGTLYNIKNYDRPDYIFLKKCQDSTGKVLADNGSGTWLDVQEWFDKSYLTGPIINGKKDGEWKKYMHDGSIYTIKYSDGKVIEGAEFVGGGKEVFIAIEQAPSFPGGDAALGRWLAQKVKYPFGETIKSGRVIITFVVERNGSITEAKVLKNDLTKAFADEGLRVINSMPNWKPGIQNGRPVRVLYSIPINFSTGN